MRKSLISASIAESVRLTQSAYSSDVNLKFTIRTLSFFPQAVSEKSTEQTTAKTSIESDNVDLCFNFLPCKRIPSLYHTSTLASKRFERYFLK